MDKAESWLYKTLQYQFEDAGLFNQALTHKSAAGRNNERLEFLGDAVLDFVISDIVFKERPDAEEGDLSKLRSSLVKDTTLAEIAGSIGLGEYLVLGSGERKTGGHRRESILADALEAIFGAVFLDGGYTAARDIIVRVFASRLNELPAADDLRDPKTRLQEWLQARRQSLPDYDLVGATGEAHEQRFEVTCTIYETPGNASRVTRGESTSRRKAEQKAAQEMLTKLLGDGA